MIALPVGRGKRDYVARMDLRDARTVLAQLPAAFEQFNEVHPHSSLKMRSPREFRRQQANLVHQWRRGRGASPVPSPASATLERAREFVELSLPALPTAPAPSRAAAGVEIIRLEFKRGALGVSVAWPVSAAVDCAAWLRELLR